VLAGWSRFLHLYLSMVSFAVVFFFAVTGITLNHPDWGASQQKTVVHHGQAAKAMLGNRAAQGDAAGVNQLGLVEMLRSQDGVHGAVSDFRIDDSQIAISFKGPGYAADAFIDRDTGKYDLTETRNGLVAVLNDLHKGRDTGKPWALVIDISAGLLVLVSLTGLMLIWFMHRRRTKGLLLALAAAIACFVVYRIFVP
jgi:uncharacterized protein